MAIPTSTFATVLATSATGEKSQLTSISICGVSREFPFFFGVSLFGGMERWNGIVEWNGGIVE